MICKNCGTDFSVNQQFCPTCGYAADTGINNAAVDKVSTEYSRQNEEKTYKMQPIPNNTDVYFQQQSMNNAGNEYQPQQPVQNTSYIYDQPQNMQQGMNDYSGQQYGQQFNAPYYPQGPANLMKKSEFINLPAMKKIKKDWKTTWVALYIVVGFNLIMLLVMGQPYLLIDVLIILGLNLGIHLGFNRGCSIAVLVYAVYNCIYLLLEEGFLGGVLILAFGFWAIKSTFAFHKQWKIYTETGVIPEYIGR